METHFKKESIFCLILISLSITSFFSLTAIAANASSTSASTTVTVSASCSLSSINDTPHVATIPGGTYKDNIGTTTFKVLCNDSGGYAVYAIGFSDQEFGNTNLLWQTSGASSSINDIATGLATSGNTSNWAMKLIPVAGTYAPTIESAPNVAGGADASFANYHVVPDTYTKVATFNSSTDASIGSAFQSTYATFVSNYQAAGTYIGKVRYTLVHPASKVPLQPHKTAPGKIGYYPNAEDVIDSMGDQTTTGYTSGNANNSTRLTPGGEATLWASNFKREGYGFIGWSDQYDYIPNSTANTGNIYGPNQTIIMPLTLDDKGLSLYATWLKSEGYLQNWQGCSTLNIGEMTALTDKRDNNTYAVARLKDGNCWMTENLRLDNTAIENTTGSLAQGYANNFIGLANPEPATNFAVSTTANSLYSADGSNNTLAITGNYNDWRFPRYNNANTANSTVNMTSSQEAAYSYGNYYSWAAAIADTGDYRDGQTISNTSICPSGWRLPNGANSSINGSFYYLNYKINNDSSIFNTADGSNAIRSYPQNFLYSGANNGGGAGNGRYHSSTAWGWSSTPGSFMRALVIQPSGIGPSASAGKHGGNSIRCIIIP